MFIDAGNDDYIILCNFDGCIMSGFEVIERLRAGYPASRGFIFTVGAGARKVASADNRSIEFRACAKFVARFASKIIRQVFRQMARVSRE